MTNWIADTNRFQLPEPPEWFLKRLFDFDAQLVLIPSRRKALDATPAYLLCRRRLYSVGDGEALLLDNKNPDTNMCFIHGVIPIAPLRFNNGATTFTEAGCDSLLNELRARDTWALTKVGGGNEDAAWQAVEAAEDAQKQKARANLREDFYHKARDAYRSLKARTGQRNKRANDTRVTPTPPQPQRVTLTDAT